MERASPKPRQRSRVEWLQWEMSGDRKAIPNKGLMPEEEEEERGGHSWWTLLTLARPALGSQKSGREEKRGMHSLLAIKLLAYVSRGNHGERNIRGLRMFSFQIGQRVLHTYKKNTYTTFSIFISRWLPKKRWLVCVWLALTLVLDLNFGRVTVYFRLTSNSVCD